MILFAPLDDYADVLQNISRDELQRIVAQAVSSIDGSVAYKGSLIDVEKWCEEMNVGEQFVPMVAVESLIRHNLIDDVYDSVPGSEFVFIKTEPVVVTKHEHGCSLYVLYKGSLTKIASVVDFKGVSVKDIEKIVSAKECTEALLDAAHWIRKAQFFESSDDFPESVTHSVINEAEIRYDDALTEALRFISKESARVKEQYAALKNA